jgi:hypothetical protein
VIEYDPVTGLIYHDSRQFATGAYLLETIQEFPLRGAGEVPFASLIVQIRYRTDEPQKSVVERVFIYLVESASINVPVADSDFQIAVPAKTAIVDFGVQIITRGPQGGVRHAARRVTQPVADALAESQKENFYSP